MRVMDRMDVAAWLQGLGLERYAPTFREQEIDWDALPKVTAEDLKDLGVVLAGHRRKLLDAITALGGEASADGTVVFRTEQAATDGERRQLTIIFCDLVELDAALGSARSRGPTRSHCRVSPHRG